MYLPERTFVIAEAGVNHNGSLEQALRMVDVAAVAGADAVKFQTFEAAKLTTAKAEKAAYQVLNTAEGGSQRAMLAALELSRSDHEVLLQRCRERRIEFMSSAFDSDSLIFIAGLGVPMLKIPSGDITCGPLLLQAAKLGRPLVLSTGMSTLAEIEEALGLLAFGMTHDSQPSGKSDFQAAWWDASARALLRERVTLLHCVTQYPAPPASVNLRAMDTMARAFGLPVGYSDHTLGIEIALAAVARGASIIEKHFTLDRSLPGPDHAASLEPAELSQLVRSIHNINLALGSPVKAPSSDEAANRSVARRSLTAARQISCGEIYRDGVLAYKRPGDGVSPMYYWDMLGQPAKRDYGPDELIEQ